MWRFVLLMIAALPLAACATGSDHMASSDAGIMTSMTTSRVSSEESLAMMSAEQGVTPCPRFTSSLDAAERILSETPKNYPHML